MGGNKTKFHHENGLRRTAHAFDQDGLKGGRSGRKRQAPNPPLNAAAVTQRLRARDAHAQWLRTVRPEPEAMADYRDKRAYDWWDYGRQYDAADEEFHWTSNDARCDEQAWVVDRERQQSMATWYLRHQMDAFRQHEWEQDRRTQEKGVEAARSGGRGPEEDIYASDAPDFDVRRPHTRHFRPGESPNQPIFFLSLLKVVL